MSLLLNNLFIIINLLHLQQFLIIQLPTSSAVCTVWRANGTRFFLRSTPTKVCDCKHRHLISSLLTFFFFYFYFFNHRTVTSTWTSPARSNFVRLCPNRQTPSGTTSTTSFARRASAKCHLNKRWITSGKSWSKYRFYLHLNVPVLFWVCRLHHKMLQQVYNKHNVFN
jgi:hypothetical protein